jgi:hypothetical protein
MAAPSPFDGRIGGVLAEAVVAPSQESARSVAGDLSENPTCIPDHEKAKSPQDRKKRRWGFGVRAEDRVGPKPMGATQPDPGGDQGAENVDGIGGLRDRRLRAVQVGRSEAC